MDLLISRLGFTLAAALLTAPQPTARTVIAHVTVVEIAEGGLRRDVDVEIEGSRIVAIRAASPRQASGVRVIDGRGRYVIPGLWDSHVHLTKLGAGSLAMFLAYGVTSVRDMGSDIDEVRRWRTEIAAGQRHGPRIKTSGPILESRANVERMIREKTVEPVARLRAPVGSPEEAKALVARLAAAKVDFLKIRSTASPETLDAVVAAARAHSLPLTGHPVASMSELARLRFTSVEHMPVWPPMDAQSPQERRAAFEAWRAAGVRMGSTTVNLEGSVLIDFDEAVRRSAADPLKRFLTPYLASDWAEQLEEKRGDAATRAQLEEFRRLLPSFYRDLREMHAAGVPFLAGSDAAVLFMHPGPTLHGELASLVRNVGLSPLAALRAATVEPARLFGLDRELGLVKPGFLADLLLLEGDPLTDITRTRAIVGVMTSGVYYDKSGIEKLLERAASDAR